MRGHANPAAEHYRAEPEDNVMTTYVLTLIGNINSEPLESAHVKRVGQCLGTTGKEEWLAENEACDLYIESTLSTAGIAKQACDALSGTAIDAVCTSAEGRRKKIFISDMDSTVINQECIDELGDAIGLGAQIREITAAVVNGEKSFSNALRERLALMKGMERSVLESVYEKRITLKAGARTLVQTMRHHGAYCILVSGGFNFFTSRIAERIGFHEHQANELVFDEGKLTGEVHEPILGRSAKLNTLMKLCGDKGLKPCDVLAAGDGANDIKMINAAGLGVAFHGSSSLKEQANACIDHNDLTALLYIQGFSKSQFVTS
jgi:phosphoserine phosphatase